MSARPVVKILPLDSGRFAPVCATGDCDWSGHAHVVKSGAQEEARWHRQSHRETAGGVAPVRAAAVAVAAPPVPRLADHARPLPPSVIARMADTASTHCALVGEPLWIRCACGNWFTGLAGDTAAEIRIEAEHEGWAREGGDGRWLCWPCDVNDDARRAVA